MAIFFLIRHATNDWVDRRIAGWTPGVHLNEEGRLQAERVAARLECEGICGVYSSPLERATETAAPLARRLGLSVEISPAFGEVQFGEWTGKPLDWLGQEELWTRFNSFRSCTRAPSGELMLEIQVRLITELERLRVRHPGGKLAIVSHGDVIRSGIAHYAGIPLDLFHRLEIGPASISILQLEEYGPRILRLNELP